MSSLWLSIEPRLQHTRLMLSRASTGIALKALLPPTPAQPRALASLLTAMVAWYNLPLCAVLDADAEDVRRHPEQWAEWLGDLDSPHIQVAWGAPPPGGANATDRFLARMGDFSRGKRLISFAAGGLT